MFWFTTIIIFLFEGLVTALTANTDMGRQGMTMLGYPVYFGLMLAVFKVVGSIVLVLPMVPARFKEWAYVGFGIDFIAAFVSIVAVNGLVGMAALPVVFFVLLVVSYRSYYKLNPRK